MKLYRNHFVGTPETGNAGESLGYTFHASRAEALRTAKGRDTISEAVVIVLPKLSKRMLLRFLNAHASHPDNG